MYEQYFGLRERAFDLSPNPRFLLLIPMHREALSNLEYGITSRQGITLLVGEAGTGKTSVIRRALALRLERAEPRVSCVYLNNPTLTRAEFIEFLAEGFGLPAGCSKVRLLRELEALLRQQRAAGQRYALVIDEAQALPDDLLEEVRLLANIELDTEKLLPLVLAGQPELADRLNQPHLRQLKQRVALRCSLAALTLNETATYVAGRIRVAGGDPARLFSRDAILALHEHARGIPRTISVICENALLTAFATARPQVDAGLIHEVSRDFDLPPADTTARQPVEDPGPGEPSGDDGGTTTNVRRFRSAVSPVDVMLMPGAVAEVQS